MTDLPQLEARGRRLQYATIAWNCGEAVLTVWLGIAAGSLALIGFGTDSVIEVFASAVVLWHMRGTNDALRTRRALRLVAAAFTVLGVVLLVTAVRDLLSGRRAEESWAGIVYLAVTAVVMFALAVAKRRLAGRLGSSVYASEATMTFLDGILSSATLLGLLLNAAWGIWWADPAAAMVVGVFAVREAAENLEEARELGGA